MSTATLLWAPETISAEPYNAQTPAGALLQHLTPADAPFVRDHFTGPFQADSYVYRRSRGGRGGTQDGPVTAMRVKSLVTAPGPGSVLRAGETVRVTGHAWSGAGPIRSVEVRADDGDWQSSVLGPSADRYGWTGWTDWTYAWTAPGQPGAHTLTVRATDVTGASQPLRPPWNEDGYGCNPVAELQLIVQT